MCGAIYSWVMLFGYIFIFLPPVLYGGSLTLSQLTGWPQWAVLIGIALVTASYTLLGGLSSVMWTDAVQCAMLVGGGVALFFVALDKIPGGWASMVAASPERFHLYRPPSDPEAPFAGLILASFGVFLFYQSTNQVMIQRVLSARSTWDGMMGIVFAGFINLIRPLVTCLMGLIVYQWLDVLHRGPSLLPDRQDQAFPYALATFAPSGMRGIILAGFFAAVMSTVSALTNAVATIFSLDVYRRFWRRDAADAELITTGRLSAAAALLVSGAAGARRCAIRSLQVLPDRRYLHGHAVHFRPAARGLLAADQLCRCGRGPGWWTAYPDHPRCGTLGWWRQRFTGSTSEPLLRS